jgi:RHS repeat-associated protein
MPTMRLAISMTQPAECSFSVAYRDAYKFTGKQRDYESNLDFFNARYYASPMGRFMTADPSGKDAAHVEDPQSWNMYAYVRNNPMTLTDPSGLGPEDLTLVEAGAEILNALAWTAGALGAVKTAQALSANADSLSAAAGSLAQKMGSTPTDIQDAKSAALSRALGLQKSESSSQNSAVQQAQPTQDQSTPANPGPDGPYKRPNNATTKEQRDSVQNKPCATCGATGQKNNADHIDPLVEQHYRGGIDTNQMRSPGAVQPQCANCSNQQGGYLSGFSKAMKKLFGF